MSVLAGLAGLAVGASYMHYSMRSSIATVRGLEDAYPRSRHAVLDTPLTRVLYGQAVELGDAFWPRSLGQQGQPRRQLSESAEAGAEKPYDYKALRPTPVQESFFRRYIRETWNGWIGNTEKSLSSVARNGVSFPKGWKTPGQDDGKQSKA